MPRTTREPHAVAAVVKQCGIPERSLQAALRGRDRINAVAGLSIEDYTGDRATPIDLATARIKAAREAIDKAGGDVLLTGRTEGFIRGRPDLEETVVRLKAYAGAGADCLYAPGISSREQITAVVEVVAPKPVNVLMGSPSELNVKDLAQLGVRRISVGGALARGPRDRPTGHLHRFRPWHSIGGTQ